MVHPTAKPSTTNAGSDDEWDVVDPNTAAVMRRDDVAMGGPETSTDRMSFVMVGVTAAVMRPDDAEAPAPAAAPPAAREEAAATATPTPAAAAAAARAARRPAAEKPLAEAVEPEAATAEEAAARMARSPALPGVSPTLSPVASIPPPPPSVFAPPPPPAASSTSSPPPPPAAAVAATDAVCLRNVGTLVTAEATLRTVAAREAERAQRQIVNEWRLERQRLGDRAARPSPTADAAIAQRIAEEDARAVAAAAARRREDEERRSAEALMAERREAELARARAGPKRCDCLGASAGHHRPNCPRATESS